MDLRDFFNLLEGWNDREQWRERQAWERARYIAKAIVSVQVDKKDRGKLEKAFALPWDGESKRRKVEEYDPEEIARQEAETVRLEKKMQKILG